MGPNMRPSQTTHLFSGSPLKDLGIDFFLRNTVFLLDPFSLRVECSQPFFWEICSVRGVWYPQNNNNNKNLRDMAGSGLHFQKAVQVLQRLPSEFDFSSKASNFSEPWPEFTFYSSCSLTKYFPLSWHISNIGPQWQSQESHRISHF